MKYRLEKMYHIKFWDHCIGIKEAMECEVVGWCIKNTDKYVVLTHWKVNNDDKDIVEDNHEPVTIVKSCIIKSKCIRM